MPVGRFNQGRFKIIADEIGVVIEGPYEQRQVRRDFGATLDMHGGMHDGEETASPGMKSPDRVAIATSFLASWSQDDVSTIEADFERLIKRDPILGRPPLVSFEWAHILFESAWVSRLSVEWVEGVIQLPPYRARMLNVTFEITRARGRVLTKTQRFERETSFRRLAPGETFEWLAWKLTGDPGKGEVYRRDNPGVDIYGERSGDVVRLLDANHSAMQQSLEPRSAALGGDVRPVLNGVAGGMSPAGPGFAALAAEFGVDVS